ncbi:hypothetical protein JNL27_10810 [bacterium]|nr:hypothetical protein [bacterium]
MSLFKNKLTEQEATADIIYDITKQSQSSWPSIHNHFKHIYHDRFVIVNEQMAIFDLTLACIAQEMQAVKNLFPKEQAARIEKWIFECINTENWGKYAIEEVKKYSESFQNSVNPLAAIPARLLHKWLDKNIRNFEVETNGAKTGIIDPTLIISATLVIGFKGRWKQIKDKFELIEGDTSFENN